jgi:hypothetical protein
MGSRLARSDLWVLRIDSGRMTGKPEVTVVNRWDEKAGLRGDAIGSQVIDALEAQEIKETGNEED